MSTSSRLRWIRLFFAVSPLPFSIVELGANPLETPVLEMARQIKDRIVHVEGNHVVVKSPDSLKNVAGKAWYVVNTSRWKDVPAFVRASGLMADYVPGKFALMQLDDAAVEQLSAELHAAGMACGVLTRLGESTVSMERVVTPTPVKPVDTEIVAVTAMASAIDSNRIKATIDEMSQIATRYYQTPTGVSVPDWLVGKYRALAGSRSDIEISKYDHTTVNSRQASVVVRVLGTSRPDEILILGSHIDSVNWSDGTRERSPGVDDNASGTATNL